MERRTIEDSPCDILLVNPPWISKDQNIWHGIKGAMPPLGLLSIAACAERAGLNVRVIDLHVERWSMSEFREALRGISPGLVGVSMLTITSIAANRVACIVKEELPDCVVVVGGVHAAALPGECLRNQAIDIVVRGDGEETFVRIAEGEPVERILGVSYRRGNRVVHNRPAEVITDLDGLPMPAYHLVPMKKYYPALGAYRRLPAINMLMTRGCPGKCTFCSSAETPLRTRSAHLVVDEIEHLRRTYGIREIQFYDDTFTVMKQNVLRFCALLKERRLGVSWTAFVRPDCFNEPMGRAMREAGCHQVMFGVESGDEEILRTIRKPIDREKTRWAIKTAQKVGLEVRAAFLLGNPNETEESMARTIDYALELDPDIAIFNITTPYPGTSMFKWAKQGGHLRTEDWNEYELSDSILDLPTVSREAIGTAYARAHKAFYGRSKVVLRQLKRVRSVRHLLDDVQAFFYIVLRIQIGHRDLVSHEWVDGKKEDFWTVPLGDSSAEQEPILTKTVPVLDLQERPAERTEPVPSLAGAAAG